MGNVKRAAILVGLALLGCATSRHDAGPGAPGWLAPDLSRVRVKTAVPAPAPRSYAETIAWLSSHTRRHAHGVLTIGDKQITAQSEVIPTRQDCVLLHTLTFEAAGTGRRTILGQALSLPEMSVASIEVTSQTGRSACVNFRGDEGVVVEVQLEPLVERSRSRDGMICFDSRDAAAEAAKALAHLAGLCSASHPTGAAAQRSQEEVPGVPPGIVDGVTAHDLVARGVTAVDVRTPPEFATGHVPGAINIPHDQLATRWSEIGRPSTPVLLYCHSGRRSAIAARTLAEKGFSIVYDMRTYEAWLAAEPKPGSGR